MMIENTDEAIQVVFRRTSLAIIGMGAVSYRTSPPRPWLLLLNYRACSRTDQDLRQYRSRRSLCKQSHVATATCRVGEVTIVHPALVVSLTWNDSTLDIFEFRDQARAMS